MIVMVNRPSYRALVTVACLVAFVDCNGGAIGDPPFDGDADTQTGGLDDDAGGAGDVRSSGDHDVGLNAGSCLESTVLCVDDSAGASQEYSALQAAANAAMPGDTVLVFDGHYAGFAAARSGTPSSPIVYKAYADAAVIDSVCLSCEGRGINLRDTDNPLSYITVEGFVIRNMPDIGIKVSWTTGVTVRGCTVSGSQDTNINGGHTTDLLLENNTVFDAVKGHGIYIANSSVRPTIRGNHIYNNAVAGIHFNGDVRYPPGNGIIHFALIEGNTIHGNGSNGINWDGVQDSVVRNNLIYDNSGNGIRPFGPPNHYSDSAEGPKNNLFVNNTFLSPVGGGWPIRITDSLGGNIAFNNILLNDNPSKGSIALNNDPGFMSGYNAVVDHMTTDRGDTGLTLVQWQTAGYGQRSCVTTKSELFINAAAGDYRLKSTSAAVNGGVSTFAGQDAPTTYHDGSQRGATMHVGAFPVAP